MNYIILSLKKQIDKQQQNPAFKDDLKITTTHTTFQTLWKQGNQKRITLAHLDMALGAMQGYLTCLRIASALTPKAEQKQEQKLYRWVHHHT